MKFFVILFALTAHFVVKSDVILQKPNWMKTCETKDAQFEKCHVESVRGLFINVLNGNYKIDGLDSIEPVKLEKLKIAQNNGPVSLDASLANLKIFGLSKADLVQNQVDLKDYTWITKFKIPKLRVEGDYRMKGQILVFPLNGHGKCWFEPTGLKLKIRSTTKLYPKDGHSFFNVTSCKIQFTMEGLKLRMANLFDGAKTLDDSINQYLNENWRDVSEALKPILSKTIEDIMLDFMQKVFHHIPGDFFISGLPEPSQLSE